jgi:thiamine biosynthesis protein ThiS
MSQPIQIHLNGDVTHLSQPISLQALLEQHQVDLSQVAIEHNREIIPRSQLGEIVLNSDDSVEIVEFIGGG